jgi:uncharacterized protein (DUF2267 family)
MQWLKELQEDLHLEAERKAYATLRATFIALRNRLTVEESAHLFPQLPLLLGGLFYEAWRPMHMQEKMKRR